MWRGRFLKLIFSKVAHSLTILVSFSNHHIKLNTIQNTYYKHMSQILPKIRILFINKTISLLHLKKLIFKVQKERGSNKKNIYKFSK